MEMVSKIKICCFAGHAYICNKDDIKSHLREKLVSLIEEEDVTTFYSGGKGDFDWLCAHTVSELHKDYPFIKSYLILAYLPIEKDKQPDYTLDLFDDTIYPGLETVPKNLAILKRNQWMIDKSDFLIAYVNHKYGGAYKTLKYASRKSCKTKIINLCESI